MSSQQPIPEPTKPLTRSERPLSQVGTAHLFSRVLESFDYKIDNVEAFINRAQHVEYGLAAEVEFAAIASWLGRCHIIHGLNQDSFRSLGSDSTSKIPDLLAVISHVGCTVPVLIEVKTSESLEIVLKPEYLAGLRAYATMVGHPLLIAWRPRLLEFWVLFDPTTVPVGETGTVTFEDAAKQDLMSALLGDVRITAMSGAGFTFRFSPTGPPKSKDGTITYDCQVKEVFWHDGEGNKIVGPSGGVLTTLLATSEFVQSSEGGEIFDSWVSTGSMISAQSVLRFSVGWSCKEGERIHWRHVAQQFDAILKSDELLRDIAAAFGVCTHRIYYQVPHTWPNWVPQEWRMEIVGQ